MEAETENLGTPTFVVPWVAGPDAAWGPHGLAAVEQLAVIFVVEKAIFTIFWNIFTLGFSIIAS